MTLFSKSIGKLLLLNNNVHLHRTHSVTGRNFSRSAKWNLPIGSARLLPDEEAIQVNFKDGKVFKYPWVYLQDNCTCSACFHQSSQSRLRKIYDLQLNNPIVKVDVQPNKIECTWGDDHKAAFDDKWLWDRNFSNENINTRIRIVREDCPTLVDAGYAVQSETFDDVLKDDSKLLRLLKHLCEFGVFKLTESPKEVGQLRKLADKIGFIRLTHYGNEFTVISKPNASNPAYTSAKLGLHTDLPYYVYPPGVQLLHCIKQYHGNDGGNSHLVDGFLVAHQLKTEYPNIYDILRNTPVEFMDIGEDYTKFYKIHRSPIFVHSPDSGNLTRIVYSNQQFSTFLPIAIEKVRKLYEAMKIFTDVCYKPKNLLQFKLNEGEMLVFDNWRFLHGREGFDPLKGERHLEGCYIDWDEVHSRMNVIENGIDLKS